MTNSRSGRIDRRRLIMSSVAGGAAILTTGQPLLAETITSQSITVLAQDASSDVPMYRGNPARTGEMTGPGPDFSNGTEVIWRFKVEEWVSSPVVVGETVYVGNWNGDSTAGLDLRGGYLYVVNAKDGVERWRFGPGRGAFSTPTVVDGVVYVGAFNGDLYAVSEEDGLERWHFTAGDWSSSSPVVTNGLVYVGGGNNLYAVDTKDGTERWRFPTGDGVNGCPTVLDEVVYVGHNDGTLFAVNVKDGTERWRFSAGGSIQSSAAVADGVVYVGSFGDGVLYAVSVEDGTERWRVEGAGGGTSSSGRSTSPAVSQGVVYSASDNILYALSVKDGTELWRFTAEDSIASPGVADGVVYIESIQGIQYALNTKDGSALWRFDLGGKNEPLTSSAVKGGVVYSTISGSVYAIGARIPKLGVGGTARAKEQALVRGGPAFTAVKRAELKPDTVVTITGEPTTTNDVLWWPVTVNETGAQGWVEASKLEPLTSGPEPTATP